MSRTRTPWSLAAIGVLVGGLVPVVTATAARADTPLPPNCSTTSYGFEGATDLTFNGRAALSGDRLRVTYAAFSGAGSAFTTNKIALHDNGSFSTEYTFQFTGQGGGGADGLVFTVQNVANNVGTIGGGLGYQGIPNSIGVELDDWYNAGNDEVGGVPNDNHVGIDINGDIDSVERADLLGTAGIVLDNGQVGHAWVDYDGSTDLLEVRVAATDTRPTAPILSHSVDLPAVLGGSGAPAEDAFIGFTAATGSAYANFDVLDWTFNNCYQPIGVDRDPDVDAGGPYTGHKGEAVALDGTVTDDQPGVSRAWSVTDGPAGSSCSVDDVTAEDPAVTCDLSGTYELTLTGTDSIGQAATDTATLTISNRAPVAGALDLTATGSCTVDATAQFTDPDAGDTHTVDFAWGDGSGTTPGTVDEAAGTGSASHTYAHAGSYQVTATVSDGQDSATTSSSYATRNDADGFLPPIGAGGGRSSFRLGSTVPVKILVTDCDGAPVTTLSPTVQLTKLDSSAGTVTEVEADAVPTNGRQLAWVGDHYQFNLSTSRSVFLDGADLTAGSYRISVTDPSLVTSASVVVDLR